MGILPDYQVIREFGPDHEKVAVAYEDAVEKAVARALKTVRNMRWFEVVDTRGHIDDGRIAHWQVTINVGFTLEP